MGDKYEKEKRYYGYKVVSEGEVEYITHDMKLSPKFIDAKHFKEFKDVESAVTFMTDYNSISGDFYAATCFVEVNGFDIGTKI